jgi:hypothetical protein
MERRLLILRIGIMRPHGERRLPVSSMVVGPDAVRTQSGDELGIGRFRVRSEAGIQSHICRPCPIPAARRQRRDDIVDHRHLVVVEVEPVERLDPMAGDRLD